MPGKMRSLLTNFVSIYDWRDTVPGMASGTLHCGMSAVGGQRFYRTMFTPDSHPCLPEDLSNQSTEHTHREACYSMKHSERTWLGPQWSYGPAQNVKSSHTARREGLTAEFLSVSWSIWVWVTSSHSPTYSEGLPELCWRQPLSSPLPMCLSYKSDHMYWLFPRAGSSVLTDPSQ